MATKPTVQEILDYYSNLLIIQYHSKPKAKAEIQAFCKSFIANNILFDVRDGYNINTNIGATAVGAQLDIIDKYVGVGRYFNGVALNDSDFLTLILLKIIQNTSTHSYKAIDESLYSVFGTNVSMYSTGNMEMIYYINSSSSTLVNAAIGKGILPRPMGVKVTAIYYGLPDTRVFWFARADGTYSNPTLLGGFGSEGTPNYFAKVATI